MMSTKTRPSPRICYGPHNFTATTLHKPRSSTPCSDPSTTATSPQNHLYPVVPHLQLCPKCLVQQTHPRHLNKLGSWGWFLIGILSATLNLTANLINMHIIHSRICISLGPCFAMVHPPAPCMVYCLSHLPGRLRQDVHQLHCARKGARGRRTHGAFVLFYVQARAGADFLSEFVVALTIDFPPLNAND
jgi:hypothetical protein